MWILSKKKTKILASFTLTLLFSSRNIYWVTNRTILIVKSSFMKVVKIDGVNRQFYQRTSMPSQTLILSQSCQETYNTTVFQLKRSVIRVVPNNSFLQLCAMYKCSHNDPHPPSSPPQLSFPQQTPQLLKPPAGLWLVLNMKSTWILLAQARPTMSRH